MLFIMVEWPQCVIFAHFNVMFSLANNIFVGGGQISSKIWPKVSNKGGIMVTSSKFLSESSIAITFDGD
jgi:hypothetical protein